MKAGLSKKEVARLTGQTDYTVDFYTNRGLIEPGIENAGRRGKARVYDKGNLLDLMVIERLKKRGFNLETIGEVMRLLRWAKKNQPSWYREALSGDPLQEESLLVLRYDPQRGAWDLPRFRGLQRRDQTSRRNTSLRKELGFEDHDMAVVFDLAAIVRSGARDLKEKGVDLSW